MLLWGLLLLGLSGVLGYDYEIYEGYRLLHATPKEKFQLDALVKFIDEQFIDMWTEPRLGAEMEIFVSPEKFGVLKSFLFGHGMGFTISARNVAQELKESWEDLQARKRVDSMAYNYADYNELASYYEEIDNLAFQCNADRLVCSVTDFGTSEEGLPMRALSVSNGGANHETVVIDSLIHAREWLAGATVMRHIKRIIIDGGDDVNDLLNSFDFTFIPVVNPDGFNYTWYSDRFWRKNRGVNEGSSCMGTDLNRNFDNNWSGPGASPLPCSDTYFGAGPASTAEISSYQAYVDSLSGTRRALMSFHTTGQYLLHPFGNFTSPGAGDHGFEVIAATTAACTAVEDTFGTNWDCGNSADVLYGTSGGTTDWAMDITTGAGFHRTLVPELRGPGFDPPNTEIDPSDAEMWNAVIAFLS